MVKKLGRGFADEIESRSFKKQIRYEFQTENPVNREENDGQKRTIVLFIIATLVILVGLIRMYDLMIVSGARYREIADNNRIKLSVIPAPRGVIYDRNKNPLARNTASYQKPVRSNISNVSETSNVNNTNKFQTISQEEALRITEKGQRENLGIRIKEVREYIYGDIFAHVLGYMTEITKEEFQIPNNKYNLGDKKGRLGLEETYEDTLRGIDGKELIEVDAVGKTSKKLGEQKPIAGKDLITSLDLKLQKLIAENYPKNQKGAVVASDPNTGEILALYSSPSFDPNMFMNPSSMIYDLSSVLTDPSAPLFNRVISGSYPPGSTFKIVTAASGLESGKINRDTEIEDVGEIAIGSFRFPNWYFLQYGKKEGMVNIVKALKRSNDIFFYKVGEMVGLDAIVMMSKKFGLSQKSGIDLPGESAGLIPDEAWKQKIIKDNWYLGDTYHLAIGQGYLLTTPIQINFMTNVIANGGKLCRPRLLIRPDLYALRSGLYREDCSEIGLNKETTALIKEGMKEACMDGGTGWPFFSFEIRNSKSEIRKIEVGCKTGTAEFGDPKNRTHAWFTVFAPVENPKITLTVLVEGAGEGSNIAAPIAKKVLEEWLVEN